MGIVAITERAVNEGYIKLAHDAYKRGRATMKRIYVEADNLIPLIEWLKTKPSGVCKVLIGGADNALPEFMMALTKEGRNLSQWALDKMTAKELFIHSMPDKSKDLVAGVVVESEK